MSWLATLWAAARAAPRWLCGALAAIGAILLVYFKGRAQGAARARTEQQERAIENRKVADRIEREIERLGPGELDRRGEPWVRR